VTGKPRSVKFIARVCRWFDRQNGNTYHSVRITRVRDSRVLLCPMTYGYEAHYRQTALEAMAAAKWIPPKFRSDLDCMSYERLSNYPIHWEVHDGTKRECLENEQ